MANQLPTNLVGVVLLEGDLYFVKYCAGGVVQKQGGCEALRGGESPRTHLWQAVYRIHFLMRIDVWLQHFLLTL